MQQLQASVDQVYSGKLLSALEAILKQLHAAVTANGEVPAVTARGSDPKAYVAAEMVDATVNAYSRASLGLAFSAALTIQLLLVCTSHTVM